MDFQQARTNMVVQQVRPWHVLDNNVLAALAQVPREMFVPPAYLNLAYSDTDIPLNPTQTMLSPKIVGRTLAALALTGQERVLEIGTGTGYITACLSKLCAKVVSIEIDATLHSHATKNLDALHCRNLTLQKGDGALGWPDYAPFDAILVTGAYPQAVPEALFEQLSENGRLVAFVGQPPAMHAVLISPHEKGLEHQMLFETVVPPLVNASIPEAFQF